MPSIGVYDDKFRNTHVIVSGAQTVTSIHSVPHSDCNAGVYSRMKMVTKVSNAIQHDCGRLWRKSKFPLHHVPLVFNWRDIWGYCRSEQLYTMKSTLHHSSHMWTCNCPSEKAHHLPVEEMAVARVNNVCNVVGTVYFILQKHQM